MQISSPYQSKHPPTALLYRLFLRSIFVAEYAKSYATFDTKVSLCATASQVSTICVDPMSLAFHPARSLHFDPFGLSLTSLLSLASV